MKNTKRLSGLLCTNSNQRVFTFPPKYENAHTLPSPYWPLTWELAVLQRGGRIGGSIASLASFRAWRGGLTSRYDITGISVQRIHSVIWSDQNDIVGAKEHQAYKTYTIRYQFISTSIFKIKQWRHTRRMIPFKSFPPRHVVPQRGRGFLLKRRMNDGTTRSGRSRNNLTSSCEWDRR